MTKAKAKKVESVAIEVNANAEYGNALRAAFDVRLTRELRDIDNMTSSEKLVAQNKVHDLRNYFKSADNDACFEVMRESSVNADFINDQGNSNKYTAKKVYELAAFLAARDFALDHYDLVAFRTILNATKLDKIATREHVQNAICHDVKLNDDDAQIVFRVAGKSKGMSTAKAQDSSSLSTLCLYGIVKRAMSDTGNKGYVVDLDAYATKLMLKRLKLEA